MTDAVRVAVRVRPLNRREQAAGGHVVVEAAPPSITIRDPAASPASLTLSSPSSSAASSLRASSTGSAGAKRAKTFTYDHVYWSADGFEEDAEGRLVPAAASAGQEPPAVPYTDQATVFQDLGKQAVIDALDGYNAAIFAYGQTGSGKTFSIIGSQANPGLLPRVCDALFREIAAHDGQREHQVTVSMLEIYNERVRDLLVRPGRPNQKQAATGFGRGASDSVLALNAGSLKVRESAARGFYVEGLAQVAVSNATEVAARIAVGTLARTTASTGMNEASSRSHMIVTLGIKQLFSKQGQSTTIASELHLVDLAGSERAHTVANSDRLREGAAINQSLSALGKVIAALVGADGQPIGLETLRTSTTSGVGDPRHIPYRSSVLTKLLRNALGGNSRTVMLATISPSALYYEESRSTLRYADGAKRIRNRAVVNESPTDKLIRTLREENARLVKQLKRSSGEAQPEMEEQLRAGEAELERRMADVETTWENRLAAARAEWETELAGGESGLAALAGADATLLSTEPFLSNVNPDPMLSHVLKHVVHEGDTAVGSANTGLEAEAEAGGAAVDPNGERTPRASVMGAQHIHLSGPTVQAKHAIIQRNGAAVTVVAMPTAAVLVNGRPVSGARQLEHLDRVVFGPSHIFLFHAEGSQRHKTQDSHIDSLDYDFVQMEIASAQGLDDLLGPRSGSSLGALTAEQRQLRQDLLQLSPMVTQANAISASLGRGVRLELLVRSGAAHALNDKTKAIMIQVTNTRNGHVWHWTKNKFVNRCRIMQEVYDEHDEPGDAAKLLDADQDQDPFWDPPEDLFLGSAYVYLQPLAYGLDIDEMKMPVSNYRGVTIGNLQVQVCLCDKEGKPLPPGASDVETPDDLLKRRVDILVRVTGASGIDWLVDDTSRGTYVKYRFYTDSKMRQTRIVHNSNAPRYDYSKQFTIRSVSNNFLNYLNTNALVLELWGGQGTGSAPLGRSQRSQSSLRYHSSVGSDDSDRSRAPSTVVSATARSQEQVMDSVLMESAWLEERTRLKERISLLQQEVAFLSIEKGALEKEVSSITLRSPSAIMGEQPAHAITDTLERFMRSDVGIRTRYELAWKTEDQVDVSEVRALQSLCEHQRREADSIASMLTSTCDELDEAVASLTRRMKVPSRPKHRSKAK